MENSMLMTYFKNISDIPRGSYNEKKISDYIADFGRNLDLRVIQDEHYNVVIFKDATSGYEDAPVVMMQAHMDMVAEKNKNSDHDFDNDPLELIEKDGYLYANNTTLGADDGVGVVYMMALLADAEAKHPALQCVFTVEEEVGLAGADRMDAAILSPDICLGLDNGGENKSYVSSSGGMRGVINKFVTYEKGEYQSVTIKIRGLKGGHSGGEISQERASALKLAGIILRSSFDHFDARIVAIDGGLKMNAIARECDITLVVGDPAKYIEWFAALESEIKTQYEFSDENIYFELSVSQSDTALNYTDSLALTNVLFMLPFGVLQMSKAIADLVVTSANIGTVRLSEDTFEVTVSIRATQEFVIDNVARQVRLIGEMADASVQFSNKYPGWNYDRQSKARQRLFEVYSALRDDEMVEIATHGGVELGIWKQRMPQLDIVSIGPKMDDIHTPDERLDIASFIRTYEVIVAFLASLNHY